MLIELIQLRAKVESSSEDLGKAARAV
jgi:hypothetical protein